MRILRSRRTHGDSIAKRIWGGTGRFRSAEERGGNKSGVFQRDVEVWGRGERGGGVWNVKMMATYSYEHRGNLFPKITLQRMKLKRKNPCIDYMCIYVCLSACAAMRSYRSIPIQWDGLMWHSGSAPGALHCATDQSDWCTGLLKSLSWHRASRMLQYNMELLLCCQTLLTASLYHCECRWQKLLWKSLSFQWGCSFLP